MLVRARAVDSLKRSIVRPVPPLDVAQGALHVRTDSTLATKVRGAVNHVARLIDQRGGTVIATRASAFVPTITRDSTRSIVGMLPTVSITADTARRSSTFGQRSVRASASGAEFADALAAIVEQFAMQGVDSALAAWVMLGRAPLRAMTEAEAADAYIELATTESIVLKRCRARDVTACLDALGIDSTTGSRLDRWYGHEDYRSLLRAAVPGRDDSVAVAAWLRCRHDRIERDCDVAAHALPNDRVPLPLSASMRFAFLREVLDAGGPGSFDRLVGSPGSIKSRLAAAAGESLDSTVVRWLDRIERGRPERMRMPMSLVVASLGWSGLILGLVVMRRSSCA